MFFTQSKSSYLPLLVCTFFIIYSHAALAANYAVSPLIIDHELEKRDIKTEKIFIKNTSGQQIRIFPTVNEVTINEGGSIKNFVEPSMIDKRETAITSWLEIGRGRVEIAPGETKELTLTIRVNPEVEPGEYHAFIGFPEGSNRPEAENKVYSGDVPGTIVRIGVDKVQNEFLRLASFQIKRFVSKSDTEEVRIVLNNPGTDPVTPQGEVIFYDMRGNEVASQKVNEDSAVVAPKTDVTFVMDVPKELGTGKYKAFLTVVFGTSALTSINDTTFFYVIDIIKLLIIFLSVLALALLIALLLHRRYSTYEVEEDDHHALPLFVREGKSEAKDHDIDLSKKI
jgi:uncharacterized protein YcfL